MTPALEGLFWLLTACVLYVYCGYPLLVFLAARVAPRPIRAQAYEPTVSLLIAAYNEQAHIGPTLTNKLALDYPPERLQIIVVSDGSTDGTDDTVREYAADGVTLLRQEPRNGKTSALNLALRYATGDILVFADANSLYDPSALRHLISNFADPEVGYVTGTLAYLNPDGSMTADGCSTYMRYENLIRTWESASGSLVGVNGGIDAVRKGLYEPMHADDLPDLVLPLKVVAKGYRVVYEPRALLREVAHANARDEYRMRTRVSLRAIWTLSDMSELLSIRRHGFYAVQLLSHKVLRYLAFFFMAGTFITAALLWPVGWVYRLAFVLQVAFAVAALMGYAAERAGRPSRLLAMPYYFVLVNAAALVAFCRFLNGKRHRTWNPRLG
ncbi:MAG: glycosyltransferase family 2 protein [Acidobacteria bacterium]|nr:glycosyltransferase family 2 protein [Acidobacteriota bacterium]